MAEPYAGEIWERIKYSWWFLRCKYILAFTVIHGFVWTWDMISDCELFPEPPKGAHITVKLQELHFHCLCLCVRCLILPAQNTAAALCFLLPCQKSHKELKDEQGLPLMVQLLTIGCVWNPSGFSVGRLGVRWSPAAPELTGADTSPRDQHVAFWPICDL